MPSLDARPGSMQGLTATVTLQADRAIMTPADSFGWDKLKEKLAKLAHFKEMTANVSRLKVPSVLSISESQHRAETERAIGINLTIQKGTSQGRCVDFFHIPTEVKLQGVITYLRAVDAINQQNQSLVDHKSDSVFIDPNSGVVTIVDTDGMSQEKTPSDAFKREWNGGVEDVIKSFFTRLMTSPDDVQFAIPAGVQLMLKGKDEYKSAGEMARDLEAYIGGKDVFYSDKNEPETIRSHFSLLAKGLKDIETLQEVQATDFSKMSSVQVDLMESAIYTIGIFRSGEPQAIDKYALGYN